MPPDTPQHDDIFTLGTGRLLTHLQLINPDRELAGKIIREIARREGDQGMSINQIADATGIPRATAQRWAKKAEEGK